MVIRIWKDSPRGDDTYRSYSGLTPAVKRAIQLHKKRQFNSVVVYKRGKGERNLTNAEKKNWNRIVKKLSKGR